jgi:carboxypeptidase Taq
MQLCRSRHFASFLLEKARETFGISDQDPSWTLDNFYRLSTWVKRGFIRVNADEVTYPLHIILRYEIERDVINGKSEVRHIPEMWDAKMAHYLKLETTGNFKDGPLQDIHWPLGLVGYFPCYTLGALMAAQLFVSMAEQNPEIHHQLARGDFTPANHWLSENIWKNASLMSADSLIEKVTGQALSTQAFKKHLEKRYVQER